VQRRREYVLADQRWWEYVLADQPTAASQLELLGTE
jgi:hypothetical protein